MELRNKLLFYFVGLVLITLASFGISAYQVASEATIRKDKELLESLVNIEAEEIAAEYQQSQSLSHLISHFSNLRSTNHIWLLVNRNYQTINYQETESNFFGFITHITLNKLIDNIDNSGDYVFNNKVYIWAKAKLEQTEFTAIHIYTPAYNSKEYSNKLATRLIVVAIIILWLAVWASLIISTAITRRIKDQQNKIEYQASHDVVTGLQNRTYLTNKINHIIASKNIASLTVIIIGIDRFREINDTLGHDFGDLLLREFGNRLKNEFWSDDTIARFGSDQYALLLPLSDHTHYEIVIHKIENILKKPFLIQDIQIITDVSIGVSIFPDHGTTAAQLLKSAEVAMYIAKKSGSFYECYEPDKDPNSVERLQLISELNYAIEKNELELHFQPKINIDKHEIISCEALLRWHNTNKGMVPPDVFIPLAEQGSIIKNLTEWVLDEAVKQCSHWHKAGNTISISVNLSARLLIENDILSIVSRVLTKYALGAEFLILEITESAIMMDPVRARRMIENLKQMGVHLSIDDFGTGYTSISHMKDLPVSEIKIDKSFIFNMLKNSGDALLVKLIIDMAHGMGHSVVAEGIEDQATLAELKSMGCDIAQGYYLGRPMPINKFNEYRLETQTQT